MKLVVAGAEVTLIKLCSHLPAVTVSNIERVRPHIYIHYTSIHTYQQLVLGIARFVDRQTMLYSIVEISIFEENLNIDFKWIFDTTIEGEVRSAMRSYKRS